MAKIRGPRPDSQQRLSFELPAGANPNPTTTQGA
jgi:hypothetical protein